MDADAGMEGSDGSAEGVNCEETVRLRNLSRTDR